MERPFSNACYGVGEDDGGEGGAIIERTASNACYGVEEGDGGEGGATIESRVIHHSYILGKKQ